MNRNTIFPATLLFRQYTAQGQCITAAGVEEIPVLTAEQQDEVITELGAEGWVLESTLEEVVDQASRAVAA